MRMNERTTNALIGIFVISAVVLAIAVLMFLEPSAGDGGSILRVRFPNIEKIAIGTRVTFAGRHVGDVKEIIQVSNAREESSDLYGNVYAYELVLQVDSSVEVYDTDEISIHTSGLLGERSIAITPNPPKKGRALRSLKNEVMYARSPSTFEETMNKFTSLALKTGETMEQVSSLIASNNEDISSTIKSLRGAIENLDESVEYVQRIDLLGSAKRSSDMFTEAMEKVGRQLDVLEKEKFFLEASGAVRNMNKITEAVNKPEILLEIIQNVKNLSVRFNGLEGKISHSLSVFDQTLSDVSFVAKNMRDMTKEGKNIVSQVGEIVSNVTQGKGDLGRILYEDNLYVTAKGVMSKVTTIMNDINHYGLLFHLDKGWQRQRTKRMNVLLNLHTPKQFRSFFEKEVDQISTSLSRVSMLLERADQKKGRKDNERAFRRGFAELLRQINTLKDILEVYNQELLAP